ncbi:sulfurtransferase complex subunit TusD [Methylomarinum sp. Ch1-1]|uniref:Sulfurtransferase complex subunit TusD n=1 Tax=Methylomarinum roseum TaxID=3067653 RepID=A0AAU7NRF4_9GAMM|nr:sulfurtransferase complex subunit TusD [Methylomarinum sp. Ch1-1]MDP4520492.1 sulfurtransferase complex subunit TusD [Methylomarinum sp. Ch1-1]
MNFAIQITCSPYAGNGGLTAFRFIETALQMNHQVNRVFFYKEGVYHAFKYNTPPDDELQLTAQWSALAERHDLDLVVCISAAQRRGLLCEDEAKRQGKLDDDVAAGFRIGGLGQLLEATLTADRFVEFS